MNEDYVRGNRGEHIKPAGRRSIHLHPSYCPFAVGERAMGRYGVETKSPQNYNSVSPKTAEAGHDEVDNIQSKFSYPVSAVPIRHNQKQRRHSTDLQEQECSDDDSKRLSKSLPETFPLHLYCSEGSNAEVNEFETSNHSHYQSFGSNSSPSRRANNTLLQDRHIYEDLSEQSPRSTKQIQCDAQIIPQNKTTSSKLWHMLPVILCLLLAFYGVSDWLNMTPNKNIMSFGSSNNKIIFFNAMSAIGKTYSLNQDSILQLQVGISSISEKEDTDSFMFVYNSQKHNFNSTVFNEFINQIASASARYLRNESASVRHIVVDSSTIVVKDTNELIHKYSEDIVKGGVIVMREIDMLPSSLAMALHYYCDVYNPLVKKSAIFFTLDIANCSDKMSTHAHIEKCLKKKWSSVSSEYIGPLLARVVSVVLDVTTIF